MTHWPVIEQCLYCNKGIIDTMDMHHTYCEAYHSIEHVKKRNLHNFLTHILRDLRDYDTDKSQLSIYHVKPEEAGRIIEKLYNKMQRREFIVPEDTQGIEFLLSEETLDNIKLHNDVVLGIQFKSKKSKSKKSKSKKSKSKKVKNIFK